MNCYNFELNISAYIEGELKQTVRQEFSQHEENCQSCKQKLLEISQIMGDLPNLVKVTTSRKFHEKLQIRIGKIDNLGPTLWERLLQIKPLGFEPAPALGLFLALIMITGATYFLLNQDSLPHVDFNKLSTQSPQNTHQNFDPSVISPKQNIPSIADSDTSGRSNAKHLGKHIKLVGGN